MNQLDLAPREIFSRARASAAPPQRNMALGARLAGLAAIVAIILIALVRRPQREPLRIRVHRRKPLRAARARRNNNQPLDLDTRRGLQAAAAIAVEGELILTTSDWNGIGSAVNLAQQLAKFSLDRRLLLVADGRAASSTGA